MIIPGLIIKLLPGYTGCTQYKAVKEISRKYKIATSTIKYIIHKLIQTGIITYNCSGILINNNALRRN